MARLTKTEKFQAKIGIRMEHARAAYIELRAKAKEIQLEARTELDKSLNALEKTQGELKVKLDEWTKAGQGVGKELKKGIKISAGELKKAVKEAYKKLP
jgi:hypothetical protein